MEDIMDIDDDYFNEIDLLFNDLNNSLFEIKPYTCEEFIDNFPKYIFFKDKIEIFRFFMDKGYSFYSVNSIAYNQHYICNIINHPNFNDFLELIFEKNKENILFFSEIDILNFITDSKFKFIDYLLNCNIFYEKIYIEEPSMIDIYQEVKSLDFNYRLEDVD